MTTNVSSLYDTKGIICAPSYRLIDYIDVKIHNVQKQMVYAATF